MFVAVLATTTELYAHCFCVFCPHSCRPIIPRALSRTLSLPTCPDDRALRRHIRSIPPQYSFMYPIRPNNYGRRLSFGRRQLLRTYCFQYARKLWSSHGSCYSNKGPYMLLHNHYIHCCRYTQMPLQNILTKYSSLVPILSYSPDSRGWLLVGCHKVYSLSVWRPLTVGQS
jgi:hypothetical protein